MTQPVSKCICSITHPCPPNSGCNKPSDPKPDHIGGGDKMVSKPEDPCRKPHTGKDCLCCWPKKPVEKCGCDSTVPCPEGSGCLAVPKICIHCRNKDCYEGNPCTWRMECCYCKDLSPQQPSSWEEAWKKEFGTLVDFFGNDARDRVKNFIRETIAKERQAAVEEYRVENKDGFEYVFTSAELKHFEDAIRKAERESVCAEAIRRIDDELGDIMIAHDDVIDLIHSLNTKE